MYIQLIKCYLLNVKSIIQMLDAISTIIVSVAISDKDIVENPEASYR